MTLFDELRAKRDIILQTAEDCGLTNVRVFGSVARGEETADSDLDILVNVKDASDPLAFVDFQESLANMTHRHVDLVFESGLYHRLRADVLKEATPL
ncbi:MAG: nucleotidyltransferase domain-containing protein [Alphaproteobacteria bacterium]|nr:nucleotidyltransferase domain-containing protein [Alphaproteobacteria bacterium]